MDAASSETQAAVEPLMTAEISIELAERVATGGVEDIEASSVAAAVSSAGGSIVDVGVPTAIDLAAPRCPQQTAGGGLVNSAGSDPVGTLPAMIPHRAEIQLADTRRAPVTAPNTQSAEPAAPKMKRRPSFLKTLLGSQSEVQQEHREDSAPTASPRSSWLPSPRRLLSLFGGMRRQRAPSVAALDSQPSNDDADPHFSFGALHMTRRQAHVHRPSGQQQAQSPRAPQPKSSLLFELPDEPSAPTAGTRQTSEIEDYGCGGGHSPRISLVSGQI
eukprot:3545959-Prymnesium_polylepis.1